MSIIYEALNKVQKKTEDLKSIKIPAPKKYRKFSKAIIFVVLLSTASVVAIIKYTPVSKETHKPIPKDKQRQTLIQDNEKSYNVKNIKDSQEFYLNGIFSDDRQPMAIINDNIVKAGDIIEGAKVTIIADDFVELQRGEEKITLIMK